MVWVCEAAELEAQWEVTLNIRQRTIKYLSFELVVAKSVPSIEVRRVRLLFCVLRIYLQRFCLVPNPQEMPSSLPGHVRRHGQRYWLQNSRKLVMHVTLQATLQVRLFQIN